MFTFNILINHTNNIALCLEQAVKMMASVVFVFILFWMPIQTFNVIIYFQHYLFVNGLESLDYDLYVAIFFFCHWLSMAHSFTNPIIYCFMSDNFRVS